MEKRKNSIHSDIPFRIRVGVVGSRDLTDSGKLASKLGDILSNEITRLYDDDSQEKIRQAKHTKLAFSVLTTLYSKAERIVAREALARTGGMIEIVLPCAKTTFLREFVDSTGQKAFKELFNRARRPINLRKQITSSKGWANKPAKDVREMLIETWHYIVDHSDVLLVVRDEKSSDDNIMKIVEYAKDKKRPMICISTSTAYETTIESEQSLNARVIKGLETFNNLSIDEEEQKLKIEEYYQEYFAPSEGVSEAAKRRVRENLLPFYVKAEKVSQVNQKRYQRAGLLVYSFSAMAVASVAFGTLAHEFSPWAFGLELLLLLAILITVVLADRNRTHRKWIESRFLAERLRAAQFLAICGVEATPIQVPPHLGAKGQADDWTLMVFNEIWKKLPAMSTGDIESFVQLKSFVSLKWLKVQIDYHKDKAKRSHYYNHRLEWSGIIVFSFALVAAALHLIFYILNYKWLESPLTFAAIVLPAVGAAIGGIRTHREYSRLAKRSENMVQSLTEMKDALERTENPDDFENLLREIEQIMLIETQDWLMLMRFAKLETAA